MDNKYSTRSATNYGTVVSTEYLQYQTSKNVGEHKERGERVIDANANLLEVNLNIV